MADDVVILHSSACFREYDAELEPGRRAAPLVKKKRFKGKLLPCNVQPLIFSRER